ncbi:hypothetical protein AAG587_08145 [Vreelandella neptunia]|uniref:hypothetical protein n=1 Tax=Vreelandella neptunia TaxID=115551 RepID=UPI00315B15D7
MERTLENLEAINEQLSIRNEELEAERLDALEKLDEAETKLAVMTMQRNVLANFAQEGVSIMFESNSDWDACDFQDKAVEYNIVFAEPYDPEGKHQYVYCDHIEAGDTLLQHTQWFKDALSEAVNSDAQHKEVA